MAAPEKSPTLEQTIEAASHQRNVDRELLRRGVEAALAELGRGFLEHPENQALRSLLKQGKLSAKGYLNQLLCLVYRVIFLLVVEDRGVLHPGGTSDLVKRRYARDYGVTRLGERSLKRAVGGRVDDLWQTLQTTFRGLEIGAPSLGLPALGGLFASDRCPAFDSTCGDGVKLDDRSLLGAIYRLSWVQAASGIVPIKWHELTPEELGGVYETLLELVPEILDGGRDFRFNDAASEAHARRASGSYYTPDKLVQTLLERTLDPVIEAALTENPSDPARALLELTIVDPACGSGHFLLAAGRRLAARVARARSGEAPSASDLRRAFRQVVARCLYGVDLNPLAVELCKVSLWLEAQEPGSPLSSFDARIRCGNALVGATAERIMDGVPDAAWEAGEGDDPKVARRLRDRNRQEREVTTRRAGSIEPFEADLWCAAFFWRVRSEKELAPTSAALRAVREDSAGIPESFRQAVTRLGQEQRFFHWELGFPHVFARGGFDVVLGNPPWIAHAGRAAQPLDPGLKRFCKGTYTTFAGYPTTHGMFISLGASLLRERGALGLIVPSSVSELPKYQPTRAAHDRWCDFDRALIDFGEGQFPGVMQPCMALVSRRTANGRGEAPGSAWPMERPDLNDVARAVLARLQRFPSLPRELFGERGFQSDVKTHQHFRATPAPEGRFTLPLREGTDVREFQLLPPRVHADPRALAGKLCSGEEFRSVRIVMRNTARYPIAALSDGTAFRNSLLAGFDSRQWPAEALVAYLNSALVRWQHYVRNRDARQPILPQVKIGHLRAIPAPALSVEAKKRLARIGARLSRSHGALAEAERGALDTLVFDAFELLAEERDLILSWHRDIHASSRKRGRKPLRPED